MFLSDALGMGLCFHKCFEVCKTLSHPFLPLNLRAVQQINQRDKITEPPSTGTESPTFPDCLTESGMVDPGPRIPTPLLFLPCQCHFTLSMFSLPRHPKQRLSSLTFQGDMGCFYPLNSSSFLWGPYLFSVFAGTDVTVIERWALSLPTWARTSLATQCILIWWHTYGN